MCAPSLAPQRRRLLPRTRPAALEDGRFRTAPRPTALAVAAAAPMLDGGASCGVRVDVAMVPAATFRAAPAAVWFADVLMSVASRGRSLPLPLLSARALADVPICCCCCSTRASAAVEGGDAGAGELLAEWSERACWPFSFPPRANAADGGVGDGLWDARCSATGPLLPRSPAAVSVTVHRAWCW